MSFYFTDEITLKTVTEDPTYGSQSSTAENIACRVEDTNRTIRNSGGEFVKANSLIMFPADKDIKKGDRIIITKKFGVSYSDGREYEAKEVFSVGGFGPSHKEVLI